MLSAWDKFEQVVKSEIRKRYSEAVVKFIMNSKNLGSLENADGFARVTGPCGDTMEIWLKVNGDTIVETGFTTDGCGTTIASGSMITEMAKGKSLTEARKIGRQEVLEALGGLPEEHQHCALLAANTLKAAILDYSEMKKHPWKKAYRTY